MSAVVGSVLVLLFVGHAHAGEAPGRYREGSRHSWLPLPLDAGAYPPGATVVELNRVQRQALYLWPPGSGIDVQVREERWSGFLLEGSLTLIADGLAAPVELAPLRHFELPRGVKHRLACRSDRSCVFYAEFADPHNRASVLVPDTPTDPSGTGPSLVDLRARYSSADVPAGNTLPLAVSAGFAWGIGFANLIRYPQGPSPELIADYFLSGLVIKGTIRVKVDGLLSPPLGPQSYYAIRHDSRVTIDCESKECLVVARRQKGDHVREVDHGAVEQGDEADER